MKQRGVQGIGIKKKSLKTLARSKGTMLLSQAKKSDVTNEMKGKSIVKTLSEERKQAKARDMDFLKVMSILEEQICQALWNIGVQWFMYLLMVWFKRILEREIILSLRKGQLGVHT